MVGFFDAIFHPFDKKVDSDLLERYKRITKALETSTDLELAEITFVKDLDKQLNKLFTQIHNINFFLEHGFNFDLSNEKHSNNAEELSEKLLSDVKDIVSNKQYILGACSSIATDAKEIVRLQQDIINTAKHSDPKLTQQALTFIKDEKMIISLSEGCAIRLNKIMSDLFAIHHMDVDENSSASVKKLFQESRKLIDSAVRDLSILQSNVRKIDAEIVNATRDVKNVRTESIELGAKIKRLGEMMAKGVNAGSTGPYNPDDYSTKKNMAKVKEYAKTLK